ncbi:hypothetical protein BC829DRAFT_448367 [Chytridium lagenaria]|nr:hypothetical protein BC829DRAFT_448367 [Chytridium lagenaria]
MSMIPSDDDDADSLNGRIRQMRKEIEDLKDEVAKLETSRKVVLKCAEYFTKAQLQISSAPTSIPSTQVSSFTRNEESSFNEDISSKIDQDPLPPQDRSLLQPSTLKETKFMDDSHIQVKESKNRQSLRNDVLLQPASDNVDLSADDESMRRHGKFHTTPMGKNISLPAPENRSDYTALTTEKRSSMLARRLRN